METYLKTRCQQLSPLSLEHRDAMIFLRRIREGLDQTPLFHLRDYVCWYWKNHIRPHFFQEERVLLPYFPAWSLLATRLQAEHDEIRELIISIDHDPQQHMLMSLCDLIESHIRFEEEQVFPYLERQLGSKKLDAIYQELSNYPVENKEWPERFWN